MAMSFLALFGRDCSSLAEVFVGIALLATYLAAAVAFFQQSDEKERVKQRKPTLR